MSHSHPIAAKLPPSSPSSSSTTTLFKPLPFHSRTTLKLMTCKCHSQPDPSPTILSILRTIPDWADAIKERGMTKKRTLYDHDKWVQHRSSMRHVRHFLSSFGSRVILSLVPPVIFFTSVAVVVAGYNTAVALEWLPEFFPILRASSLPYQLTAPALALLLVFRTEASYSRFEEGKKAWTKVVAGTNDFARQVIGSVEGNGDKELRSAILQYIIAFPVALKVHFLAFTLWVFFNSAAMYTSMSSNIA